VDHELYAQLESLTSKPGATKGAIVDDALRSFLGRRGAREIDDLFKLRLDRMTRHLDRIERHQQIMLESLALFVRYQFTVIPPLPESEQAAARALAQDRYQAFIEQVGRRIAGGRTFSAMFDPTPAPEAPRSEEAVHEPV
jgi:hypothetical protein